MAQRREETFGVHAGRSTCAASRPCGWLSSGLSRREAELSLTTLSLELSLRPSKPPSNLHGVSHLGAMGVYACGEEVLDATDEVMGVSTHDLESLFADFTQG